MDKLTIPAKYDTLTPQQRRKVRERYVKLQGWKCQHCGSDIESKPPAHIENKYIKMSLFPKGFLDHPIHLHHCHKTGMTIGAVHARCNAVLWQYHHQ